MSPELWLAFVVAAGVVIAVPGPTNLLVVAYTLRRGRRAGLATVLGVLPGVTLAMVISLAGLGALLATSVLAFSLVKWVGAAYLVYLGVRQWRAAAAATPSDRDEQGVGDAPGSDAGMLRDAFLVTLLNPKGIVFFSALFPQFLQPGVPLLPQMLILGATFLVIAALTNTTYALLAGALAARLGNARWRRRINRAGGSMLVGAGVAPATLQRG